MGSSRGAAPSPLDPRGFRGPGRLARGGLKAQPSPEPACPDPAPQTQEQLLEQRRNVESIFTETCYHTHIPPTHTHHTIYPTHIYRVHTYVAYLHVYTQHTYPCPIHTPPHISTTHTTHTYKTHSPYASQLPTQHRRTHAGDCFISPRRRHALEIPCISSSSRKRGNTCRASLSHQMALNP